MSPNFKLVVEDVKVFLLLWVHPSLDLNLLLLFLLNSELFLPPSQLGILIVSNFSKGIGTLSSEPGSNSALNVESRVFSLLAPHLLGEVALVWSDDLVVSSVQVEAGLLALNAKAHVHLDAHFAHHHRRLCLVFISLNDPLVFLWVIVSLLICLGESMVISLPSPVVSETSKVCLGLLLLLNFNGYSFYL